MLLNLEQDLAPGCISDLTFDKWRGGELDEAGSCELSQHLAACRACALRHTALSEDAQRFLERRAYAQQLQRVRTALAQRRRQRRLGLAGSALAVVAALALWPLSTQPSAGIRRKGTSSIGFYVRRGEEVFRGRSGEHVRPGDQLRFTWRADRPSFLAILSLDTAHVVSTYYPPPDARQPLPAAGREVELDGAVELDEALGPEQVFAVSCRVAISPEPLRRQLATTGQLIAPPGCSVEQLELFKEPRR